MQRARFRWILVAVPLVFLLSGATAGALLGARHGAATEEELALRSSRIVSHLLEWLPEEPDPAAVVYDGIGGMLQVLDPHSNFLEPESFERMRARQEGSFFGVGIIISMRNGQVTVIAPMAGTPAASKGVRAGDVIAAVEGQRTEEMNLDEVVELVRGAEGTPVLLTLERPGLKEPFDIEIIRARIPTNSVRFAFLLRPEVGYIRLGEFSNTSLSEVRAAVDQLRTEGMERLVFDLRNNPGGPLDAAVGITDLFLRKGQLIVSTRGRTPDSESTLYAPGGGTRFEGPLVVLVNEGSASASEIVAGAVQDHDRGLVVGEITWGKGLVQTVYTVRDAGLALTTARYYTPAGRCIQRDYASFIDYITHRNGVSTDDSDGESFATDSGRTVLGGGGVTPDVTVEGRPLIEPVVRLFGGAAFFRHAVAILKDVPTAEQPSFAESFEVSEATLDAFLAFARKEDILEQDGIDELRADAQALDDVRRSLRVEVLNAAVGLEAGYRHGIEADDQVLAALDHLGAAAEMWETWQRTAVTDPN